MKALKAARIFAFYYFEAMELHKAEVFAALWLYSSNVFTKQMQTREQETT